jgi:hypothetical protein
VPCRPHNAATGTSVTAFALELLRSGYDPHQAAELAAHHDVDIRRAATLLEQGCPADLALQILL